MQMRLTWVSGDKEPQLVQYEGKSEQSEVTTFTQEDMCGRSLNSRETIFILELFNFYVIEELLHGIAAKRFI